MGVDINYKLIYGFKTTGEKRKIFDYYEKKLGCAKAECVLFSYKIDYIQDNYSGEFEYLGHCLFHAGDEDMHKQINLNELTHEVLMGKLQSDLKNAGLDYYELVDLCGEPNLYIISYYS